MRLKEPATKAEALECYRLAKLQYEYARGELAGSSSAVDQKHLAELRKRCAELHSLLKDKYKHDAGEMPGTISGRGPRRAVRH